MCTEEFDMTCRIHRLEDVLLRSKDFNEQLRIRNVLNGYRKKLQEMVNQTKKTVRAIGSL